MQLRRAKNVVTIPIHLQWVDGNETAAEESFYVINGSATLIDETEMEVIKARKKPNAIATTALMRSGTGMKYHLSFPPENIAEIESLAREVYDILFKPTQPRGPIKTTDLPIASKSYTPESFKMLFDFVNLANGVTKGMWREAPATARRRAKAPTLPDDLDGSATIGYLQTIRRAARLLSSDDKGSLGLHPIVYSYDASGKFQPTAFLAAVSFFSELRITNQFIAFTDIRRDFEEFLVRHRHFINHLGRSYGSRTRPLDAITTMYRLIFQQMRDGTRDDSSITITLLAHPKLRKLSEISKQDTIVDQQDFTRDVKSAAFLRDGIDTPIRCKQCGARLHSKSMSADHATRKEDGGLGEVDNLQWMHPFCNTGYKEKMNAMQRGDTEHVEAD